MPLPAGVVDELSLVVAPSVAGAEDKPLFMDSIVSDYALTETKSCGDVIQINYKKK